MHSISKRLEFPPQLQKLYQKAIRYEFISFLYMISTTIFSFSVMSNSQTMKTVWLEDMLGIIPPASFLIASKIIKWRPNKNFPYGFHKVNGIAFLTSSLALLFLGVYLFADGLTVLIKQQHPAIPTVYLFGHSVWMGFIMIVALLWSSVPSTILGHIKIPLAHRLYDKILYADSKMNKASWMSGFASILGIIGIGFGFWWADATVGMVISLNIMNDGYTNVKQAILDLIDEVPKTLGSNKTDPLLSEVNALVEKEPWVKSVKSRFRDDGHVFFGEVFVETKHAYIEVDKIMALQQTLQEYNWRLHDITIMPVNQNNTK